MRWIFPAALVVALAGAGAGVIAQTGASAPAMQEAGGVKYLSGGVGEEERRQMDLQAEHFPLRIVFSVKGGAYAVADSVNVHNRSGEVLAVSAAGPLLMLNLPPGAYVVKASFGSLVQERAVSVGGAPQTLNWLAPPAPKP